LGSADGKQLATCFRAKRSRWLDDLIDRYFFERVINRHSPKGCTFFLEKQMLNELARLIFSDKLASFGAILGEEDDDAVGQAVRFIESHLFEEVTLDDVAAAVKSTPSTLMRRFKKSLVMTVGSYIKDRRLDEAAAFIAKGDYQVGDVCSLVGYQDLSAFTRAFKAKFGIVPSMYRGSVKD
jgi:AraC-like DNA-binding protein